MINLLYPIYWVRNLFDFLTRRREQRDEYDGTLGGGGGGLILEKCSKLFKCMPVLMHVGMHDLAYRLTFNCLTPDAYRTASSYHHVVYFLLPTACCLLPAAYCLLHTACCLLLAAYFLFPASYFLLPTSCCLLPVAYFLQYTSCCLFPAAYFLLPTSCCLLPAA